MITIKDFSISPAFTDLELDGAICYTRIFLETVLMQYHENVIVKIFVKEKSDAIFKDTGGFTDQIGPTSFNIVIFKDTRKKMIATLSHELVHVKQHLEYGFFINRPENSVMWKNKFYMTLSDLISMHRQKSHELYALLPWEHDANLTLLAIIEMVTERFETLCKSDPNLKDFLKLATTNSTYNALTLSNVLVI